MEESSIEERSVTTLNLSARPRTALALTFNARIEDITIGQLIQRTENDLLRVKGLAYGSLWEIATALEAIGLTLRGGRKQSLWKVAPNRRRNGDVAPGMVRR